ncbi:MAG: hypothetical protein K2X81_16455 [Candidatus Obscuribacterales bacterium]|nr:hypothetical protein [Candidatus Obscuribacterales bacterium]
MRRWLGIAYVGVVVTACSIVLSFALAPSIFPVSSPSMASLALDLTAVIVLFSLCSLPFDIVGFNIERLYGRTTSSLSSFLAKQIAAAFRHGVILLAMALIAAFVSRLFGLTGLLISSVFLSCCLLAGQLAMAKFYGGFSCERAPDDVARTSLEKTKSLPLLLAQADERCFSGGIVGLPFFESIVIPKQWLAQFSPPQLSAELTRRNLIVASGGRFRGVLLALIFTNIGVWLAALLTTGQFSLPLSSVAGLVTMSAAFTLWSFIGLLVLPLFSHFGVYEADRLALENGVNKELLFQVIAKIDADLEDEPERTVAVDTIFHPVPTIAYRLQALEQKQPINQGMAAWQAARYAIFLSVIGLGLLGRAVHCNAGKPELWAMLPAD